MFVRTRLGVVLVMVVAIISLMKISSPPTLAATYSAGDTAALTDAINAANASTEPDTITLTADITLTGPLPTITSAITIAGNGYAIDGNGNQILRNEGGTLTLNNLTITEGGGGLGGGVYNIGTLTVNNCTFSNNYAGAEGGGIYHWQGTLTIVNSTFAYNIAVHKGGGIYNMSEVTITGSTFYGNEYLESYYSGGFGSGGALYNASLMTLTNTLLSNNRGDITANCGGTFTDGGGNLIDTANGGACKGITPLIDADPLLGAFNGTYIPLLAGSPAIDAAPNCAGLTHDQIGTPRPQGPACDIGAIEALALAPDITPEPTPDATAPPSLNEWHAEADEDRAHAWGMDDGVQGTVHMWEGAWQYNAGGIPQELIDYGVIVAVDVWVLTEDGTAQFDLGGYQQICLRGEGRMIFMDATQSPRPMVEIEPVETIDGYTCGWIPNAGTVILIGMEPQ